MLRKIKKKPEDAPTANIIGPAYGMFNQNSDLAEIKRLLDGLGVKTNLVFPLGTDFKGDL